VGLASVRVSANESCRCGKVCGERSLLGCGFIRKEEMRVEVWANIQADAQRALSSCDIAIGL
jgi:hypothetical protein